ncbi:MAG: nucleotidyltransferase [Bacteroidetes bacterium]|nr:nucleotidyltransferase [Bacteroidota bacterium]
MQKPTLLIMAAGMGSRYGGLKQMDGFGPNGETILEYSIYDAIRAGFGKVVFVIREDFETAFKDFIIPKISGKIDFEFAFQSNDVSHYGFSFPDRQKPWGTAHAILAAKDAIHTPFCVVNADDFYGQNTFEVMADFLNTKANPKHFNLVGFRLGNTLSEFGHVSRGICEFDATGALTGFAERTKIYRQDEHIVFETEQGCTPLPDDTLVSMNFWGFTPEVFQFIEARFLVFLNSISPDSKAEYFIALFVQALLDEKLAQFDVIPTQSDWFGVTYPEDKPWVQDQINQLVAAKIYPDKLW